MNRDAPAVRAMIAAGVDVNAPQLDGATALHWAAHYDDLASAQVLINAGADPSATVMIGDTTYDMEMARRAGTMAVGVAWGYHSQEYLRRAGAHAVAQNFADLTEKLADLGGNTR